MSRSRKKTLISPNLCSGTDGQSKWKKGYNRLFRRKSKIHLNVSIDESGAPLKDYFHRDVKKRHFADIYDSPSDGFHRIVMLTENEFDALMNQDGMTAVKNHYFPKFIKNHNIKSYKDYVNYFNKTYISK